MTVHHDSGQRTIERRGYSSRPVGSCGTICTSVTTDASKITCRRRACAKHAAKVEQPRRIALVIAPATKTHCGDENDRRCAALRPATGECGSLGLPLFWDSKQLEYKRRPECLAAEVRS